MTQATQDPPADAQILRAIRALRQIRALYTTDREKAEKFLKPLIRITGELTDEQADAVATLDETWEFLAQFWGSFGQDYIDDIVADCLKDIRKEYPRIFDVENRCLDDQA